ncbi:MAG: zf-HC2 domain-containing protein [Acidobacteriota bacterium]|nr:zf-HC2 domain-containing protein [Acidobacteriota bacterium]MDH3786304.1 zf-HC2 domain-containing protein [Acidobacteriota bacterium]
MNCKNFKEWLYHFQQNELSSEREEALLEHADACPPCGLTLEFEATMLATLKKRLQPTATPVGLESRVRGVIENATPGRLSSSWFQRPFVAAVAASLLLAVLVIPSLRDGEWLSFRSVRAVSGTVTVVDPICEKAGRTYEQQRRCKNHAHLNTLVTDDGTEWNISLDDERFRGLLTDTEMRGRRMRVRGNLFGPIRTLQLVEAEVLNPSVNEL